jgi:choline-sulfatase
MSVGAAMLTRREFVLPAAGAPFVHTRRRGERPPSVVMFMTDDHGAWATGAYGCREMRTPNIDSLAASGVRFTNAFACTPVCSPSRMTYMTGTLPSHHGVQDWLVPDDCFGPSSRRWLEGHLPYASILARNGYTLGMSGKWHMGGDDHAQEGFTGWSTVPGGGGTYRNPAFIHNGERVQTGKFKTDSVGDFALEFLSEQKNNHPFYLLVPFYAPHTPYDFQPEEYRKPYESATFRCFPDLPVNPSQNESLRRMHGQREPKHAYSALVTGADANIGRIVRRLEALDLRDDTLVVFTADQGWNAGHHGVWGKGNGTIPFNIFEESMRVPLIWSHPKRIRGRASVDALVSSYDYFPSILEYLRLDAPSDRQRVGRSYAGFLGGRPPSAWRNRLYFEYAYVRGIRTPNLKYIERAEGWPGEMFDLESDPGETRNVIDDPGYRKQRDAFHEELTRYFEDLGLPPLESWRETTRQRLPAESRRPGPGAANRK